MIYPSNEFWEVFKYTKGALSCCESLAIMQIAAESPNGLYLEAGTFHGKSALSAAYTLKEGAFYLLDPIFEDRVLADKVQDVVFNLNFGNISVIALKELSTDYIPMFKDYSYVFVDSGSHADGLPMQEVKLLEDRIVPGGIIAFHDFRSQFSEVEIAYNYLLSTRKYDEILINWQDIIAYVKENDLERNNDTWHHTEMEFPCFVGALKRK